MSSKSVGIIAAVCAVVGISAAFLLLGGVNSSQILDNNQEVSQISISSTFSEPVKISQSVDEAQPAPNITISDDGKIYVLYQDSVVNEIGTNLYLKTSTNNGKSFSEPIRVNSIEGNVALDGRVPPAISLGENNQVFVLWANQTEEPEMRMGVYRQLIFATSLDDGQTFPSSMQIKTDLPAGKYFQDMMLSNDGTIHVAWLNGPSKLNEEGNLVKDKSRPRTLEYTQSTDGGKTFETTKSLMDNPCPCCNVQVAADDDNVYVSWRAQFPNGEDKPAIRDMVIASSTDNGKTFSDPVRISEDNFEFDGCVHVGAPMEIDSKGNLHTVWYTGKEGAPGMYYSTSTDNGKTFSEPMKVLVSDWIPPQRIFLTIDDNDTVWVTWEDATGLSTNDRSWRYGDTQAMIWTAQIHDGELIRSETPINTNESKSLTAIESAQGIVSIVWTEKDNSIMYASNQQ